MNIELDEQLELSVGKSTLIIDQTSESGPDQRIAIVGEDKLKALRDAIDKALYSFGTEITLPPGKKVYGG